MDKLLSVGLDTFLADLLGLSVHLTAEADRIPNEEGYAAGYITGLEYAATKLAEILTKDTVI